MRWIIYPLKASRPGVWTAPLCVHPKQTHCVGKVENELTGTPIGAAHSTDNPRGAILRPVRFRPLHLATLGLTGLTLVVSCRATKNCAFSGGTCGGDDQSLSPTPASAPTFGPTDPTLDSGCDDRIRQSDMTGVLDGGDGDAAAPGARCSAPSDCAPVSCSCVDGGAAPPDDDAGDAATDGGGDGGDRDAEATLRSVDVRACVCSTRACATPPEACALATRFRVCQQTESP